MKLVELLFELSAKWRRWEEEFARQNGLTPGMVWVLMRLDEGEAVCSKELAKRIDLSLSRASRLVDQMVNQRLLYRDCDSEDRRRCTLSLSAAAAEIRIRIMNDLERLQSQPQLQGQAEAWSRMIALVDSMKGELSTGDG